MLRCCELYSSTFGLKKLEELQKLEKYFGAKILHVRSTSKPTLNMVLKEEIEKKINNVHDTLIDFHNNLLSTKLISYKDIINELKNFQVPDEKSILPINVKNPNLEVLRKITKYGIVLIADQLFVVFAIPTLNREKFFLHKVYSIPKVKNDLATFIVMPDDYITFDDHHEKMASLSVHEVETACKRIKEEFFCENLNTFNKAKQSCLHSVFYENFRKLQENCKTEEVKMDETLIRKTSTPNKYLITSPNTTFGKLALKNGPQKLKFSGTQLLEVQEDAKLYINEKEIEFYTGNVKIKTEFSLVSDFPNVDMDLQITEANYTKVGTVEPIAVGNRKIDDEISSLKKTLLEKQKKENSNIKTVLIILGIILLISIIIIVSLIICIIKRKKEQISVNENEKENSEEPKVLNNENVQERSRTF